MFSDIQISKKHYVTPFKILVSGTIIFFASWNVYCHFCIYANKDFTFLKTYSFVPLFLFLFLCTFILYKNDERLQTTKPDKKPISTNPTYKKNIHLKIGAAFFVIGLYYLTQNYLLFWVLALCIQFYFLWEFKKHNTVYSWIDNNPYKEITAKEFVFVIALMIFAMALTLFAHRPDPDDAMYISFAISSIDYPSRPLLTYDGMYGIIDLPIRYRVYRLHTYELLVAVLSQFFHQPVLKFYYIIIPTLMGALVVAAHWLAIRIFTKKFAVVGLATTLLVLIVWGDSHRAFGNFSFVRLFQGKSMLVSFFVPVIVYYAVKFLKRPNYISWLMLFLTQVAACGITSNAVFIAPVTAGVLLMGGWFSGRRKFRVIAIGLLASVYVVSIAGINIVEHKEQGSMTDEKTSRNIERIKKEKSFFSLKNIAVSQEGLKETIGDGLRGYLALLVLISCSLIFSHNPQSKLLLLGYTLSALIFVLNPFASVFISQLFGTLSWRIFWCIPFPLIFGIVVTNFFSISYDYKITWGYMSIFIFIVVFAFSNLAGTVSPKNNIRFKFPPRYKIGHSYQTTRKAIRITPPGGVILAHWNVSTWIPTFHNHPETICVRNLYLKMIKKTMGNDEFRFRRKMTYYLRGMKGMEVFTQRMVKAIKERNITTIVFWKKWNLDPEFYTILNELGFKKHKLSTSSYYQMWSNQI